MNFSGIVIHGKKLGRTIGYPTANIKLESGIIEDGVYALQIDFDNKSYTGMGSYRENMSLFEAHIFDFSGDLYDKNITIKIVSKIRDNIKFNSLLEIKNQIQKDELTIRAIV